MTSESNLVKTYYGRRPAHDLKHPGHTESKCFARMFEEIANLK